MQDVKVWDPLVRVFHWTLVAAFAVAFLSEDEWLGVHTLAGYTVATLILVRLVWGVVGTRYARFSDFVRGPTTLVAYLRSVVSGHPPRHLGHNPAGGAMVVALLTLLLATAGSGLLLYGLAEQGGPLAFLAGSVSPAWSEALEEGHELLANLTLFAVVLHVAGVLVASWQHRENLVRSMLTGFKRVDG